MRMALAERAEAVPAPRDDDEALVERFRGGDGRAFDELVRRYRRAIFHLALRYVKASADAEDVAQRAFVRAFEKIERFRGDAAFRTWLYRITVNLALNHLRDHARVSPTEIREEALAVEATEPRDDGEARRLRGAIERLPPKQRLVMELRIFEELSFREVAEVAECSEDSAKANYQHGLKRLRELMKD